MEKQLNIPKLRFPEFVGNWEKDRFGKIATSKSGKFNPEKENIYTKCIELEHLSTESGQISGYINGSNSGSIKNKFIKGDVLFGKLRPYLKKYHQATFDGVCSTEIWVLKGIKISNDFLYRIVQTNEFIDLANQSSGSKMPRADWSVVANGIFSFPTLNEQTKIANFLTAADEKLTQLKKKKSLLEQYKKGVMQKLLSQELRFKDENDEEFGEWEEKQLGELFVFNTTNSFSRDNLNYEAGIVKNIHYGDIHTKFKTHFDITKELVPFVNEEISLLKFTVSNFCKTGDLIIADASEDYADIGKAIEIVNLNNEKVIAGLHTLHARPNLEKIAIGYSGHLMKSESVRLQIKTQAQGTKVLSITTGRLANVTINLPCIAEQTKIANFLSAIDDKINHCGVQIEKMEGWKKGLLQKMFV